MNHELALKPETAVDLMNDLWLITPETFDQFLIAVLSWYQEEGYDSELPPNLYELLEDHEPYTKILYDIFVESLAIRHSYHKKEGKTFDAEQKQHFSQLFKDNLKTLYGWMIWDYERLLRSLNLVYIWDSTSYGGEEFFVKNEAICEVW